MLENICWLLIGFLCGLWVMYFFMESEKEDPIEYIPPTIREERKNVRTIVVQKDIPDEELLFPPSKKWFEKELQFLLAEQIWDYAMVTYSRNYKDYTHTYRAMVQVVDNGRLNPFLKQEG